MRKRKGREGKGEEGKRGKGEEDERMQEVRKEERMVIKEKMGRGGDRKRERDI